MRWAVAWTFLPDVVTEVRGYEIEGSILQATIARRSEGCRFVSTLELTEKHLTRNML